MTDLTIQQRLRAHATSGSAIPAHLGRQAADALDARDAQLEMERDDNATLRQRLANKDKPGAMCCMCFDHFTVDELSVTPEGEPVDVCKLCAAQEAAAVLRQLRDSTARVDTLTADIEERNEIEGELKARVAELEAALHKVASESDQFGTWPHYHLHTIARAALGGDQ